MVRSSNLDSGDYDADSTSIRYLCHEKGLAAQEALTGEFSFGAFFENEGYKAIPSPRQPSPGDVKSKSKLLLFTLNVTNWRLFYSNLI